MEYAEKKGKIFQWGLAGGASASSFLSFVTKGNTALNFVEDAVEGHDAVDKGLNALRSTMEALNEKIKLLEENLVLLNQDHQISLEELNVFQIQSKNLSASLSFTEKLLKTTSSTIDELKKLLHEIPTWIPILNKWIIFLDELQAETERIPKGLNHDDSLFQRISANICTELHQRLNTSQVNELEIEACKLASHNDHCVTLQAEYLPVITEQQSSISDLLNALKNL